MTYRAPLFCNGEHSRLLRVCANSDALPVIERRAKELGIRVTMNMTEGADGTFAGEIIVERNCEDALGPRSGKITPASRPQRAPPAPTCRSKP